MTTVQEQLRNEILGGEAPEVQTFSKEEFQAWMEATDNSVLSVAEKRMSRLIVGLAGLVAGDNLVVTLLGGLAKCMQTSEAKTAALAAAKKIVEEAKQTTV